MSGAWRRVAAALRIWPDRRGWLATGGVLLWALPLLAGLAFAGGIARYDPLPLSGHALRIAAAAFVVPAFGEELLFRALLVPRPEVRFPAWQAVLAVGAFVAWHPLQAVTLRPNWSALFLDPWFLAATAVLGAALVRIYRATGSIWPCVASHWLVVVAWKLLFAGPFG